MLELKPCPFCGAPAERSDCVGCGYIQIRCSNQYCGANMTLVLSQPGKVDRIEEFTLVTRWGRRTNDHGSTAVV